VELLGKLQQHRQSVLHSGSGLAADWTAHAAHRSASVPKPNRSDVRPLPITRRITQTHSPSTLYSHTRGCHSLTRTHYDRAQVGEGALSVIA
jgi:hypothetical protein